MLKLAVVIPTFNRRDCVQKLLWQLYGQQLAGIDLAVVLVIDGSTDGTLELVQQQFPQTHVVQGRNWWFTRSVNEGFKYAERLHPDALLILNDDLEIEPSYLQTLVAAWQSVPQPAIMGSATLTSSQPRRIYFSGTREIVHWRFKSFNYHAKFAPLPENFGGVHPTCALPGRGMLIPFATAKQLGYLDERFPQYCSDDDFTLRAAAIGVPSYISWDAVIYSHVEMTGAGSSFIKQSWGGFLKSLFNPYSRSYLLAAWRMLWRHGSKPLFPLAALLAVGGKFKSFLLAKKI